MRGRAILIIARRPIVKCLLIASAFGWVTLAWLLTGDRLPQPSFMSEHAAHPTEQFATRWLVMVLAMTPPLLIREIGGVWRSSLRRARYLTVASFVIGYAAIWMVAGEILSTLLALMTIKTGHIVLAAALAFLWHGSPARQRCLNACHRAPTLRMFGAAAQWDSIRYGVRTGGNCVAACFLVMLLAFMFTKHHFAIMAVAAVVMTVERYLPARRPRWRFAGAGRRSLDWPAVDVAIT